MFQKCFLSIIFLSIIFSSLEQLIAQEDEIKQQKETTTTTEKNFYITPRIFSSTFTGNLGIEIQYKHIAFDIGDFTANKADFTLTSGIKYYFNSHHSTWYIGFGGGIAIDEFKVDEYDYRIESFTGFLLGYRWRWKMGWDLNLGVGPLFPKWTYSEKGKNNPDKDHSHPPMFELTVGFSF